MALKLLVPRSIKLHVPRSKTVRLFNQALTATSGSIERAADWLFSHVDDLDRAVDEALGGGGGGGGGGGVAAGPLAPEDGTGEPARVT